MHEAPAELEHASRRRASARLLSMRSSIRKLLPCGGGSYPPMREKISRKGAPPQAEVTKSL
jgi:hypothetical protein